ncbi:MAG: DUF255 domain-containing protein [Verrucomicrobia bacterium]|nr:MAG: DUF255 domain-containing protein [Verrucomicrobiota bacterium]
MKSSHLLLFCLSIIFSFFLLGCRQDRPEAKKRADTPEGVISDQLKTNQISKLPGAIYQSQAKSTIPWQPWTRETLLAARDANRLVFAVVGLAQHPGFIETMQVIEKSPIVQEAVEKRYVPILIDGDASREMSLLSSDLATETQIEMRMPMIIWMTPTGNPIGWVSVSGLTPEEIVKTFTQSDDTMIKVWLSEPSYVINNSTMDNDNRRERYEKFRAQRKFSQNPSEDVLRGMRQLISLYDPVTRTMDQSGGLFPSGIIQLLACAANHPQLPEDLQNRSRSTLQDLMKDIMPSAMMDPLDGGVFMARHASSWQLPFFITECVSQSRAVISLFNAYGALGDEVILERALRALDFAEKTYQTSNGLFAAGMASGAKSTEWMWSPQQVGEILTAEDAAWWMLHTGMKPDGNIPNEADIKRRYFRLNTLAFAQSLEQIAASTQQPLVQVRERFERCRQLLLAERKRRLGTTYQDTIPHPGASFRMVAAYAAAFSATGEERFRQRAVEVLALARTTFSDGTRLMNYTEKSPPSVGAGRAFLYSMAIQAALDVADITQDPSTLQWAEDLMSTTAELFAMAGYLKECPDEAKIIDLPISDSMMIFDETSMANISLAAKRLEVYGRPTVDALREVTSTFPSTLAENPVLFTDLIYANIARYQEAKLIIGEGLSPEMQQVVQRLPLRWILRRAATSDDQLPTGAVALKIGDQDPKIFTEPSALREAIFPNQRRNSQP